MACQAYLLFGFILHVFVFLCNVEAAARIPATLEPGPNSKPRISISLGTPPQKQLLHLDLDASVSYLPCKKIPSFFLTNVSSSYKSISCSSKLCSKLNPGVASSCKLQEAENCTIPLNNKTSISLFRDSVAFKGGPSTRALFGCSTKGPLKLAALSRSRRALPFTITSSNNLPRKFTLCLSPDNASSPIFFGDDSSFTLGGINVSNYVQFIPLKVNPLFPSSYFLSLTGIRIDSSQVSLSPSLFSINPTTGTGGLKLSTRDSFSKLPTPAYEAIAEAFKSFAAKFNIPTVAPVAPVAPVPPLEPSLKLCFNASSFSYNRLGPVVPVVELMFENGLSWRFGGSSSIKIKGGAGCLAFVDAGQPPVTSTIGLFQMLDNLLHFDVAASRFGFVDSSLHILRQNCRTSFS